MTDDKFFEIVTKTMLSNEEITACIGYLHDLSIKNVVFKGKEKISILLAKLFHLEIEMLEKHLGLQIERSRIGDCLDFWLGIHNLINISELKTNEIDKNWLECVLNIMNSNYVMPNEVLDLVIKNGEMKETISNPTELFWALMFQYRPWVMERQANKISSELLNITR